VHHNTGAYRLAAIFQIFLPAASRIERLVRAHDSGAARFKLKNLLIIPRRPLFINQGSIINISPVAAVFDFFLIDFADLQYPTEIIILSAKSNSLFS